MQSPNYAVIIIKASRKPIVYKEHIDYQEALKISTDLYEKTQYLFGHQLSSAGISLQIVYQSDIERISKIEIGGLQFHGISPVLQIGCF